MIIDGPDQVTKAVLSEIQNAPDARFREVMSALVRHLHAFIREVKLTEDEFRQAGEYINAIGQNTNAYHNEAVLMSGSLGVPIDSTDTAMPSRSMASIAWLGCHCVSLW